MIVAIIIIGIFLLVYIIIGIYFFNFSTNPKFSSKKLFNNKGTVKFITKESTKWFNNVKKIETYIKSYDKKKLHAYEINNKFNTWIILVHGYTNNALEMIDTAYQFYKKGYSLLIIDQRAHGKSEGIYSTLGWNERRDMLSWIIYLNKKKKIKIVLYGISMGGTVIMRTIGEKLPLNVICAIEDCGFISNYDQFYHQLKYLKFLPRPIIFMANVFSVIITGFNIYKVNPIKQLKKGKIPMLFIHGGKDKLVPTSNAFMAYDNYESDKEILIIENAKHMKSSIEDKTTYYNKIFEFISKQKKISK